MRRRGWWGWCGLAGLGALVLLGGLWTRHATQGHVPGLHPASRAAVARQTLEPRRPSTPDPAPDIGLVAGRSLRGALAVSFLDSSGGEAVPLPGHARRPLLESGEQIHLAAASARLRTVPEAPGLVLLALVALGAGRRRAAPSRRPAHGTRAP